MTRPFPKKRSCNCADKVNLTGTITKQLCGLGQGAGEKKQQVGELACELHQVHRRGGRSLAPGVARLWAQETVKMSEHLAHSRT